MFQETAAEEETGTIADGGQFGACTAEFGKLECRRRNGECGKGCRAEGSRTSRREQSCVWMHLIAEGSNLVLNWVGYTPSHKLQASH